MRYMTKEWYKNKKKHCFPMQLEIINNINKNVEDIFSIQYKKTFNDCKKTLPANAEAEIFESIFSNNLKNVKTFFSKETLDRVLDIRLLALGKVFKEEYELVEGEIINKDMVQAYKKQFNKIENTILTNIRENLNLHDCIIRKIYKNQNNLIVEVDSSNSFVKIDKIVFNNYEILEEEKFLVDSWILYNEIYINNSSYEFHMLITGNNNLNELGYFTIKADNILFQSNNE